jgi:hypothetical protein
MAMLPETRDALARYDEWLARTVKSPNAVKLGARRLERTTRSVGRRMRNMAFGVLAVLVAAFLYGNLVAPLGFLGLMVTMMAAICAMFVLATWPAPRAPTLEKLPEAPLATLPAKVESWLEGQRLALPAPAAREVDQIMAQLDRLGPELRTLDPATPQAEDARKLLSDHLPRLVKSYAQVPAVERGTAEAQGHFRDGLRVVGGEIDRLTTDIARERLRALESEGRFLESRYGAVKKE